MTKYIGVIGNRDYIKYHGEKRPFWEFLNVQPDGWLTSLVYQRKDLPEGKQMIWDCGAWSYRNEKTPRFKNELLTPGRAIDLYSRSAKEGDFVIAPDHMLIEGVDLDFRRCMNLVYADEFIQLVHAQYNHLIPMACVHGMDIEERLNAILKISRFGYKHFAIGGIAARASKKREVTEIVTRIKSEFPLYYFHILGLSSPDYFKTWNRLGIDSCDGSSHFKQAFTAGAFFALENGKLKKHQAARPGEDITAPECHCLACSKLREDCIDTRQYGSNEHNMGRAAHNLNMLMISHNHAIHGTTYLVSCVKEKSKSVQKASDLYQSQWFKKARSFIDGKNWYILSAAYGLVHPDDFVHPYDVTLNDMSSCSREMWAMKVREQILARVRSRHITVLAGQNYRRHLIPMLEDHNYYVEVPMKGLGIGQQMQWLDQNTKEDRSCSQLQFSY